MTTHKCMITEVPVTNVVPGNVTVTHQGEVIGVVSLEGLDNVKTIRLTLSRPSMDKPFHPIQGQYLETFDRE